MLGDIPKEEALEGWTQRVGCGPDGKVDAGEKGPVTLSLGLCGHSRYLTPGISTGKPEPGQEA